MASFRAFIFILLPLVISALGNDTCDRLQELEERLTCVETTLVQMKVVSRPRDCRDVYHQVSQQNGVYLIWPDPAVTSSPVHVPCYFDDDGQWIVLQRRVNGDVNFQKSWQDCKDGFGRMDYNSDFWLGLENMHQITCHQDFTLRVDVEGWDGRRVYAEYSVFFIKDEKAKYAIYYDGHSGTAEDGLGDYHRGMKFTTIDSDNDYDRPQNCAAKHGGPWWFNNCDAVNLNGRYGERISNDQGIEWGHGTFWKNAAMRIRPTQKI